MGTGARPTPAQQLAELLTRCQNPFDVPDHTLARLSRTVLCHTELRGRRHQSNPPPELRCSSYRHTFLLADGSALALWELRYDAPEVARREPRQLCEIYPSEPQLLRAEERVHRRMAGGPPGGTLGAPGASPGAPRRSRAPASEPGAHGTLPPEYLATEAGAMEERHYDGRNSPDHARRLLRRAENPDRPGEEVLARLTGARGHDILHVPRPHGPARELHVWCALYQHAFLLADGEELSLFELEHNLSRTGRLICEVYGDAEVADRAAHRRAREHGIGL
ncbi:hypothetical protein E0L36_15765 [Streptomyces sp. AJS327]|uniref:DUF6227 family protein n=1 Tax=Streptomyces sp. AJS327 TaxID=2545265 RepID=UPI0015E0474B|nr:DUF6227 family protein [Streptomyces sp. AJS327]MBA0052311.1 hypothetical protein [Streptomyces sp. AJS327]